MAFTRSIRIDVERRSTRDVFHRAFTKTKPAQNFQMRDQLNFQTRSKFQFEQSNFLNKISALALAGAGGIEPPNGGIKIRCLTAWLRPNVRAGTRDRQRDLFRYRRSIEGVTPFQQAAGPNFTPKSHPSACLYI
jgi:hypothetical protein